MGIQTKKTLDWLKPYKPAKTIYSIVQQYGIPEDQIIKLAGNESRFGASDCVAEVLFDKKKEYAYYPDFEATVLREKLADFLGTDRERIVCASGSFELISLLAAAYINPGDESIYASPTFGMCIGATVLNGGKPVSVPVTEDHEVDLDGFYGAITENTKIIWICNPNNPTGTLLPGEKLVEFINRVPDHILIVLDEAYIDFVEEAYLNTIDLIHKHDNLIVLRTFSKAYGLASFRIGYGVSSVPVIEAVCKAKLPINTSLPGQEGAIAALNDQAFVQNVIETVKEERRYYYREFERLGLTYVKSHANFILVRTGIDSEQMEEAFLSYGIMVRSGHEYGDNYKDYLRISIGKPEDNRKVITALEDILKKLRKGG